EVGRDEVVEDPVEVRERRLDRDASDRLGLGRDLDPGPRLALRGSGDERELLVAVVGHVNCLAAAAHTPAACVPREICAWAGTRSGTTSRRLRTSAARRGPWLPT